VTDSIAGQKNSMVLWKVQWVVRSYASGEKTNRERSDTSFSRGTRGKIFPDNENGEGLNSNSISACSDEREGGGNLLGSKKHGEKRKKV